MELGAGDEQICPVRAFVYDFLVTHERPPTAAETATSLNIPAEAALAAYRRPSPPIGGSISATRYS